MALGPADQNDRGALIDALVADQAQWLLSRCAKAAAGRAGLDAADVYQQTIERLLRASVAVDPDNQGLRTFLGRCVDWVTQDLTDQQTRQGGVTLSPEKFGDALERSSAEGADEPTGDGSGIAPDLLAEPGLNEHQVRAVLNECGDPGVSVKEFAHLVARSYDAVRKDKERALSRLRKWLCLDEEETRVFKAVRCHGSVRGAAEHLQMPELNVRDLLARAQLKIDNRFNGRRVDRDVP